MEQLVQVDRQIFTLINQQWAHSSTDGLMRLWSAEWPWFLILSCFIGMAWLAKNWQRLIHIVWIGFTIGIADIVAHNLFKPFVGRVRPCRTEESARIVDGCSGYFTFPSNHASNAAVFATMWFVLHSPRQGLIAVACGLMVGLSRIYLGVHYPLDVLGGYLFGFTLALFSLFVGRRLEILWRQKRSPTSL